MYKLYKNNKWLILFVVCMGLFMILLDSSVVNLAIPEIMKTYNVGIDQIEWINNAYILAFAMLLIVMGRLGDQYGPKKLFIGGLVVFTIGSMLTSVSRDIDTMIFFRVIQGIGGAAMLPATLSIISLVFPPEERGTAMGAWGAISGLAIVLGPIIGGYLTTLGLGTTINNFFHISEFWRYVFYINVPVGILTFFLSIKNIPKLKMNIKYAFDTFGFIVLCIAIFTLTYSLIEGQTYGWFLAKKSVEVFGNSLNLGGASITFFLLIISALCFLLFIIHEKSYAKDALVDIKLFKDRNFSVGNFSALIFNMIMMGTFFILPLFLQGILGFTPIKAGENILPFAIAMILVAPIAGKLSDKIGSKYLIVTGLIIMAMGEYMLGGLSLETETKTLILPYIIMGSGIGMVISPLTNITLINIKEEESGSASGVYSTTRQIGSVIGIAVLGAILQIGSNNYLVKELESVSGFSKQYSQQIINTASQENISSDPSRFLEKYKSQLDNILKQKNIDISSPEEISQVKDNLINTKKQSFVVGMNKAFRISSLLTFLAAFISLSFKKEKLSSKNKKTATIAA